MRKRTNREFEDDNNGHDSPHCINTEAVVERLVIIEGRDQGKNKTHFERVNNSPGVFFCHSLPFSDEVSHFFHFYRSVSTDPFVISRREIESERGGVCCGFISHVM